ncbi:MAG TPA: sigma-70 family RNA polymerase sigma factor [Jatrophihabitans sp.]|nr:sigma-70 family RNA polymerase sigma factor [Jatrophihabitans sp.]
MTLSAPTPCRGAVTNCDEPSCRPGGCARLCTEAGLAAAHAAYAGRLHGRAYRVTRDHALADEAVQEAFVRAWRACKTFDPAGGPVLRWLMAITGNVAIDLVKARQRRPQLLGEFHPERDPVDTKISDVDLIVLRAEIEDALSQIGSHHRDAVVETILRDRSYAEVAAELEIPAATVRTRVHYALRHLRCVLRADRDR